MNQKNIQIIFILLAFLMYLFLLNFNEPNYIKVEQINQINQINKKTYYEAILYTNQTCKINIDNFNIIKKIINDINKNNINYFTKINKKFSNLCGDIKTPLSITIDFVLINISYIFLSFLLSFLVMNLSFELVELIKIIKLVKLYECKKNDNIGSNIYNNLIKNNEIDYEIIEINETNEINKTNKTNKIIGIN